MLIYMEAVSLINLLTIQCFQIRITYYYYSPNYFTIRAFSLANDYTKSYFSSPLCPI